MDNIERTYRELFGNPQFMIFFDESYEEFRQQIINLPYYKYDSKKLPFEGISLTGTRNSQENSLQSGKSLLNIPKKEISLLLSTIEKYLKRNEVTTSLSSLISSLHPTQLSQKHIFYLYSPNCCRAYGYYNEVTQGFVILKGSLVPKSVGITYANSPRGALRDFLIKKNCKELKDYYIVHTDIACNSAATAATFVLGRIGSVKRWIDEGGKTLSEVYPF